MLYGQSEPLGPTPPTARTPAQDARLDRPGPAHVGVPGSRDHDNVVLERVGDGILQHRVAGRARGRRQAQRHVDDLGAVVDGELDPGGQCVRVAGDARGRGVHRKDPGLRRYPNCPGAIALPGDQHGHGRSVSV